MAKKILKIGIDTSKIDKYKLSTDKNGKQWLNITLLLNDTLDQYNNIGMIVQDVSKSDREAGIKGNILGNAKEQTPYVTAPTPQPQQSNSTQIDDLPF
jgi:hypothetical protein